MTFTQIAKKLRSTRTLQKLSIKEASKQMKISPATLWKLETARAGEIRGRTKEAVKNFINSNEIQKRPAPAVIQSSDIQSHEIAEISRAISKLSHELQSVQDAIFNYSLARMDSVAR